MANSLRDLVDLILWRDGGQRGARRNAWAAMVADAARARARAEAEAALPALPVGAVPVSSGHGASG